MIETRASVGRGAERCRVGAGLWRSPASRGALAGTTAAIIVAVAAPGARDGTLLALFVLAAVVDWRTLRIPNWLTAAGGSFALLTAGAAWESALAGGLVALALGTLLVVLAGGAFGMGDVKLLGVAGAATGVAALPMLLLAMSLAGGGLALREVLVHRGASARVIAYGPAIAAGAIVAMWAAG